MLSWLSFLPPSSDNFSSKPPLNYYDLRKQTEEITGSRQKFLCVNLRFFQIIRCKARSSTISTLQWTHNVRCVQRSARRSQTSQLRMNFILRSQASAIAITWRHTCNHWFLLPSETEAVDAQAVRHNHHPRKPCKYTHTHTFSTYNILRINLYAATNTSLVLEQSADAAVSEACRSIFWHSVFFSALPMDECVKLYCHKDNLYLISMTRGNKSISRFCIFHFV